MEQSAQQSAQPDREEPGKPGQTPHAPAAGAEVPEQSPPKLSATPPYLQELSREYLNVRVLDPLSAYRIKGQRELQATAFLADSLLVRGRHPATIAALELAAADAGFELEWDPAGETDDAL